MVLCLEKLLGIACRAFERHVVQRLEGNKEVRLLCVPQREEQRDSNLVQVPESRIGCRKLRATRVSHAPPRPSSRQPDHSRTLFRLEHHSTVFGRPRSTQLDFGPMKLENEP